MLRVSSVSFLRSKQFGVVAFSLCVIVLWPCESMADDVSRCLPKIADFDGADIETMTVRWDLNRKPDTGGANMGKNFGVPSGRVIVGWKASQTSCIRCKGDGVQHVGYTFQGPLRIPTYVHVGVRFNKGCLTCPGASYTGTITAIHVPASRWKEVLIAKYLTCEETESSKSLSQELSAVESSEEELVGRIAKLQAELAYLWEALGSLSSGSCCK